MKNTVKEWEMIFIVGGLAYILPGILFIICGTGKLQKWNEPKGKREEDIIAATVERLDLTVITKENDESIQSERK